MNIIWSKNGCIYCDRAKELFESKGVEYEERNIEGGKWTMEQMMKAIPSAKTFPQIVMGKKYVGGYQELITYFALGHINL